MWLTWLPHQLACQEAAAGRPEARALHCRLILRREVAWRDVKLLELLGVQRLLHRRVIGTEPPQRLQHARVEELADLVRTEIEPRRLLRRRLGQAWG